MADLLIATKAFCNTLKAGSFTGDTTMCPTRSQIEAAGLYIKKGYTYATDQLVPQDHIERLDWEYTFSVTPTTATISAAGGSQKFTVTSYKRQYSYSNAGNRIYVEGSQTNVAYTSSNSGSGTWNTTSDTISYGANTGSTQPGGTITWTQSESFGSDPKKTATATHKQNADSIKPNGDSYSNPRITAFSYPTVIPAAGGNSTPSYSYEQTVYWVSGKTTTLTSGGTPTFNRTSGTATVNSSSGLANTGSKGTTRSGQTTVAVVSLTITMNGKSSSASSANVSQAENSYSDAWNTWVVTCTPNPTTISASGGTSTLSGTAHRDGTRTWSSGSTQPLDSGNQNVTSFSIVSPVSGFSISGAVVTANSNSSTSTRSVRVRGTYSGVNSPEATITQSAATERTYYEYSISLNPTSASFSATGESKSFTVTSQRRLVTVNSVSGTTYGSWGSTGWEIYPTNLGTGFSQTTSGNTITVKASANSGSSRSGTLSVRCTGDTSETASANLSQSGATTTTTTEYEFSVSPTSLSFTKDGGNQTVSIVSRSRPKYTNDINGEVSYGNWSAVSYTASSTNSAFSSTTPTGTGTNSASVSVGVNTGAARSATITYTQSGSGTKKTVSCSQAVGTQTRTVRDYSFSANPTSLSFDASGGTKSVTVTSQYRDGTQSSTDGGNNWSSTSWGSWQTASYTGTVDNTGGGAFSGSGNSVTAGANSSTSRREGNLKLSQPRSGIQENGNSWPSPSNINVPLNQEGKVEIKTETKYLYRFRANPMSLKFKASGGTLQTNISSNRAKYTRTSTDGGNTWGNWVASSPEGVSDYTETVSGDGFTFGGSGGYVTAYENDYPSKRYGKLILKQNRPTGETIDPDSSYHTITIDLEQEAGESNIVDLVFTVSNDTGNFISGLSIWYTLDGNTNTIFTAASINPGESRGGHAVVPKNTTIRWSASVPWRVSPANGYYSKDASENFSIHS